MRRMVRGVPLAAVALVVLLAPERRLPASEVYHFQNISANADGDAIENQLTMTVYGSADGTVAIGANNVNVGANQALFVFTNPVGIASNISEIYFQQGTGGPIGSFSALYNNGTTFTHGSAAPPDLPSGNNITPEFKVTNPFKADIGNGTGVNSATSSVGILYNLSGGLGFNDVVTALLNGYETPNLVWQSNGNPLSGGILGLRVGLHVRSIPPGLSSAAFINTAAVRPPAVPEPSTLLLGGLGLLPVGWGALRRRRRLAGG
jgi:hypothetical protein